MQKGGWGWRAEATVPPPAGISWERERRGCTALIRPNKWLCLIRKPLGNCSHHSPKLRTEESACSWWKHSLSLPRRTVAHYTVAPNQVSYQNKAELNPSERGMEKLLRDWGDAGSSLGHVPGAPGEGWGFSLGNMGPLFHMSPDGQPHPPPFL